MITSRTRLGHCGAESKKQDALHAVELSSSGYKRNAVDKCDVSSRYAQFDSV